MTNAHEKQRHVWQREPAPATASLSSRCIAASVRRLSMEPARASAPVFHAPCTRGSGEKRGAFHGWSSASALVSGNIAAHRCDPDCDPGV